MPTPSPANPARTYTNAALTVIAGLLAVGVFQRSDGQASLLPAALAQPADAEFNADDPSGRISAAEQRKVIISELRGIAARMERIESRLTSGLAVKVTDMPPVRVAEPRAERPAPERPPVVTEKPSAPPADKTAK
jgi:hypothetical protein